jgi:hypothetical protein
LVDIWLAGCYYTHTMQKKYTVKQTVTYYAEIEADTAEDALWTAEQEGRIEVEVEAVESDWEIVA